MKSLFPSGGPAAQGVLPSPPTPVAATRSNSTLVGQSVSTIAAPPGPNAFEVGVIAYDPDTQVLNVRIKTNADAEEIDATVALDDMTAKGTVEIVLGEGRLAPRIEVVIHPRVKPPKFTSPEEADAWLEAHA